MEENNLQLALPWMDRAGSLLTSRKRPWISYLLAFFLPVLIMQLLWAISGVWPFGHRMILAHDQWHQYYPFFVNFRERLLHGNSLFYSWNTGMGTNYLGLYGYYLASPLNWLAPLIPESLVLPYYTLTVLIRIGCAGLFFLIFLHHTFHRCEPVQAFFSTMYALCAFIMGYYWNAIWLDTVALLPLVVLGTLQLLRDGKFILYVASLALAVMCSYYIGLFVCIFVFLLFIGYNFVNWDDFAGLRSRLWRIAFFTIIALGISAVVTGPALLSLRSTYSAVNKFPTKLSVNIAKEATVPGILDALRQVIANSAALVPPTSMTGLPNIYCGVVTVLLAAIYCCCRHVPVREKIFSCFLLAFFALSFIIRQLDYIWHGFHFPNMLPYRFSFLYSFVLLFMAYRAFSQMDRFRMRYLLFIAPAMLVFLFCTATNNKISSIIATVLLLAIGGLGLLLYGRRQITRNALALILCVCLLLEGISSASLGVREVSTTDGSAYPRDGAAVETLVNEMNAREAETKGLWRAEFALKQTLNDSTLFSMPGISVFASTCNSAVSSFLQNLGIAAQARSNRYVFEQADPAIHLLLNLKYLIDREGLNVDPTHFTEVAAEGDVKLLENKDFLPMGWAANPLVLEYDPTGGTQAFVGFRVFSSIEELYCKLLGADLKLYHRVTPTEAVYEGEASGTEGSTNAYTFQTDGDNDSRLAIRFTKSGAGGLSIYTIGKDVGNVYVYRNDEYVCNYSDKYGQLRFFGDLKDGDVITLRYRAKTAGEDANVEVYAADFDNAIFQWAREQLSSRVMTTDSRSDTEITGTILTQNDSVLFTTIPYDAGWHAYVDGEEVRITPVAEAFVAFRLSAGSHEIRLHYETPGLNVCFLISLACLAVFLVLLVLSLLFGLTKRPMAKIELSMDGMSPDDALADELLPEELPLAPDALPPLQPPAPRQPDAAFDELFDESGSDETP